MKIVERTYPGDVRENTPEEGMASITTPSCSFFLKAAARVDLPRVFSAVSPATDQSARYEGTASILSLA